MRSLKNKKVLITCGPTWIAIDDMRVISNRSTGELGQIIAKHLSMQKAKVTLVQGPVINPIKSNNIKIIDFCFYDDFLCVLKKELTNSYDIIIHAAAVSDYRPKVKIKSKLSSNLKELNLKLVPTKKIINLIKKAAPKSLLVGFKLESETTKNSAIDNTKNLFAKSKCDLVIANSVKKDKYFGYIINKENKILNSAKSRKEMALRLVNTLKSDW